jgi:hypothetical protein
MRQNTGDTTRAGPFKQGNLCRPKGRSAGITIGRDALLEGEALDGRRLV